VSTPLEPPPLESLARFLASHPTLAKQVTLDTARACAVATVEFLRAANLAIPAFSDPTAAASSAASLRSNQLSQVRRLLIPALDLARDYQAANWAAGDSSDTDVGTLTALADALHAVAAADDSSLLASVRSLLDDRRAADHLAAYLAVEHRPEPLHALTRLLGTLTALAPDTTETLRDGGVASTIGRLLVEATGDAPTLADDTVTLLCLLLHVVLVPLPDVADDVDGVAVPGVTSDDDGEPPDDARMRLAADDLAALLSDEVLGALLYLVEEEVEGALGALLSVAAQAGSEADTDRPLLNLLADQPPSTTLVHGLLTSMSALATDRASSLPLLALSLLRSALRHPSLRSSLFYRNDLSTFTDVATRCLRDLDLADVHGVRCTAAVLRSVREAGPLLADSTNKDDLEATVRQLAVSQHEDAPCISELARLTLEQSGIFAAAADDVAE